MKFLFFGAIVLMNRETVLNNQDAKTPRLRQEEDFTFCPSQTGSIRPVKFFLCVFVVHFRFGSGRSDELADPAEILTKARKEWGKCVYSLRKPDSTIAGTDTRTDPFMKFLWKIASKHEMTFTK